MVLYERQRSYLTSFKNKANVVEENMKASLVSNIYKCIIPQSSNNTLHSTHTNHHFYGNAVLKTVQCFIMCIQHLRLYTHTWTFFAVHTLQYECRNGAVSFLAKRSKNAETFPFIYTLNWDQICKSERPIFSVNSSRMWLCHLGW